MHVVTPDAVKGKKVLLRLDIDVPIKDGVIQDDFRLKADLPTLKLCLENAERVRVVGHLGRPNPPAGGEDPNLSIVPVVEWFKAQLANSPLLEKLEFWENTRFDPRESFKSAQDKDAALEYAKELAEGCELFIFEAFAAHHPAASTTGVMKLLPSYAGLQFEREVREIREIRDNPKKPLIAIVGGAKIEDKYEAVVELSKFCDAVLVGGLLAKEIKEKNLEVSRNVMLGKLSEDGLDLAVETVDAYVTLLKNAKQVIWSGPMGKYEDEKGKHGTNRLAEAIVNLNIDSLIAGGDTVAALKDYLDRFTFVSTGGGAMLELLTKGTLPTLEVLN